MKLVWWQGKKVDQEPFQRKGFWTSKSFCLKVDSVSVSRVGKKKKIIYNKRLNNKKNMSKETAYNEAIRQASERLRTVNLVKRCEALGLPGPREDSIQLKMLGTEMRLVLPDFQLTWLDTGQPAKVSDRILVLHYLLCDVPVEETGELITFRQLESGQFYWPAFLERTVKPLLEKFGHRLNATSGLNDLKQNLERFDWQPAPYKDFSARIHIIGKVYLTLIYHLGDDEFSPSADILFDRSIRRVFPTEDVAVLASRLCLGLI